MVLGIILRSVFLFRFGAASFGELRWVLTTYHHANVGIPQLLLLLSHPGVPYIFPWKNHLTFMNLLSYPQDKKTSESEVLRRRSIFRNFRYDFFWGPNFLRKSLDVSCNEESQLYTSTLSHFSMDFGSHFTWNKKYTTTHTHTIHVFFNVRR